ncbi:CwfJ C-terminus 1-domain-containing protein-like protein [Neohortaea acidophila]|uniref:CwfJ C-terminus 1-domain-containing protein-like protein n=1 Tax=Neohortaea acidophila TaxID=245834 RepID=A0A6A6PW58_9PEZI|nr:CwfJ C-terminus 1-domain-containing protein-like protein [Neohortaea acidophila]KAF2484408.1 CwfJ C-terminus 1-domain-containing protein-like protein [Neohortaea acidophila]
MGLEDFERELAEEKLASRESKHSSRREHGDEKDRHRSHRHHRDRDSRDGERRHRHKRHRDEDETKEERRRHRKRPRSTSADRADTAKAPEDVKVFDSPAEDEEEDEWVEKEAATAPPEEDILDQRDQPTERERVQRDAWMQQPSVMDVEIVASRKPKAPPSQFVGAKEGHELKVHNQHLADLERDFEEDEEDEGKAAVTAEPAQHDVDYTFGDSGSSWRMTKLKAVYRTAKESQKSVEEVAIERFGSLRDFDDAREEERELDRRKMYGKEYVGLEKPSGELYQERKMQAGLRRESDVPENEHDAAEPRQGQPMPEQDSATHALKTAPLDTTALNKLKAQLMKARLRKAPNLAQLEEEYRLAEEASSANSAQSDVVVLNNMENRMLASGRAGEVTAVSGKRGRERGLVVENEDMSIEDMVRQERRTKGGMGNEGRAFAERIAKDGKFVDDLDYMDDNAQNLSKKVVKSDTNLRSMAVGDFQKMQRVLEHCPLCHHEDRDGPEALPTAPVVSLATRVYLTLPTEPEMTKGGAVIVPIQHRLNLLECDDDEWEEMRNFMKSLTRYYDSQGRGVIFYENAAHMHSKRGHAALNAVPLPSHLADTAPAYFKEAILASAEQWSQHKPIIDTLALSQQPGYGKLALRKAMVKEMPYFHVFFNLDGGMGHVIEDERKWPKGDLFAREIVGGMLDRGPEIVKRQGRWERGDRRVEGFRKKWAPWDWTKILMEAQ